MVILEWASLVLYAGFWIFVMCTYRSGLGGFLIQIVIPLVVLTVILSVGLAAAGLYAPPDGQTLADGVELVEDVTHGSVFYYVLFKFANSKRTSATPTRSTPNA